MQTIVFETGQVPIALVDLAARQWGADITAFKLADAKAIILFEDDFTPICVTVFDSFTACGTVQASGAVFDEKKALSRAFLKKLYQQVFDVWKVNRMNFFTDVSNQKMLNMHERLGHVFEGTLSEHYGVGKDGAVYRFNRRDWEASIWHPQARTRRQQQWEVPQRPTLTHMAL